MLLQSLWTSWIKTLSKIHTISALDRVHRVGPKDPTGKPRPILVKFARYGDRAMVFRAKSKLKRMKVNGNSVFINEDLTKNVHPCFTKHAKWRQPLTSSTVGPLMVRFLSKTHTKKSWSYKMKLILVISKLQPRDQKLQPRDLPKSPTLYVTREENELYSSLFLHELYCFIHYVKH